MENYYPYAVVETNVDPKFLKYNLKIINATTGKILNDIEARVKPNVDYDLLKISSELYKTQTMKISFSEKNIEDLKDCVIIFDLFRLSSSGVKSKVVNTYYIHNILEQFDEKKFKNVVVDKIRYFEKKIKTQVVIDQTTSNTFDLILRSSRIFQCIDPECRPGEPKDPFSKARIEAGLQPRLNQAFPDQDLTSLCGPAAFFFCLINLSPSKYKLAVKQLWETGQTKIGELSIQPSQDGCRRVKNFYRANGRPKISPIDWITLASLRESENASLKLNDPTQEVAGITLWGEMHDWFKKSGFKIEKEFPFKPLGYNDVSVAGINRYAGDNYYVVTLISASILDSGASSGTNIIPDHWIVWTDKLRLIDGKFVDEITDPAAEVRLKLFSWGENRQSLREKTSLSNLAKKVFYALIIKKENF